MIIARLIDAHNKQIRRIVCQLEWVGDVIIFLFELNFIYVREGPSCANIRHIHREELNEFAYDMCVFKREKWKLPENLEIHLDLCVFLCVWHLEIGWQDRNEE